MPFFYGNPGPLAMNAGQLLHVLGSVHVTWTPPNVVVQAKIPSDGVVICFSFALAARPRVLARDLKKYITKTDPFAGDTRCAHWIPFNVRVSIETVLETANVVLPEGHIISVADERFRYQEVKLLPSFTRENRVRKPQHVFQSLVQCAARVKFKLGVSHLSKSVRRILKSSLVFSQYLSTVCGGESTMNPAHCGAHMKVSLM